MNRENAPASQQPPDADGDLCGPQGLAQGVFGTWATRLTTSAQSGLCTQMG
ncbi:C130050O18Rik [Phodopus roborovskii]|uniref:C130050O18Rik protein n=1 Tax=Phodopus roborovskii TaxID=109678 RepID=A0AAV0A582_PHORO|nr:C130050O18Rik [Phodopus roborovskii]